MTDIEVSRKAKLKRISDLLQEKFQIEDRYIEPYGHYKAKLSLDYLDNLKNRKDGRLILVTAISPTPAGEGKQQPLSDWEMPLVASGNRYSFACGSLPLDPASG